MPRTERLIDMAKDAYYFSHDSNARHDPKIVALLAKHGAAGYGRYWMVVETLRNEDEYRLDFTQEYIQESLAATLLCNQDELHAFIGDCVKYHLLSSDDTFIWSESLLRRMEKLDEIKAKRAEAGAIGGTSKANAKQMEANAKQSLAIKQSKAKQSKAKQSKVNGLADEPQSEYTREFNTFWDDLYPKGRRVDKKDSFKSWKARLKDKIHPHELLRAAHRYAEECEEKGTENQYILLPTTFLNGKWERWSDEAVGSTKVRLPGVPEEPEWEGTEADCRPLNAAATKIMLDRIAAEQAAAKVQQDARQAREEAERGNAA